MEVGRNLNLPVAGLAEFLDCLAKEVVLPAKFRVGHELGFEGSQAGSGQLTF
jgi:hypothetical protein